MSIVWGLKNEKEAALLAAFMSRVFETCDPHHAGKKLHVPFGKPPCVVRVPIEGKATDPLPQQLTLDVPADFPVRYYSDRWQTFMTRFFDDYTILKPRPVALAEDKQWLREFEKRIQEETAFLPNALWMMHGERVFLEPTADMHFVPVPRNGHKKKQEEGEEEESGADEDVVMMDLDDASSEAEGDSE